MQANNNQAKRANTSLEQMQVGPIMKGKEGWVKRVGNFSSKTNEKENQAQPMAPTNKTVSKFADNR